MFSRAAGTGGWGVGVGSLRAGEPCPEQAPFPLPRQGALHRELTALEKQVCVLADQNYRQHRFAAFLYLEIHVFLRTLPNLHLVWRFIA